MSVRRACTCHGADRRKSEELSEEEEEEEEERLQAAVEVVGEMQLTAEQLKVTLHTPETTLLHPCCSKLTVDSRFPLKSDIS